MGTQLASLQSLVGVARPISNRRPHRPRRGWSKTRRSRSSGRDLYDFIQRVSKQAILPEIDSRVDQRVAPVAQQSSSSVRSLGPSGNSRLSPRRTGSTWSWTASYQAGKSFNGTAPFTEWLSQRAPYTRESRGCYSRSGVSKRRCLRKSPSFFEGYRKENAVVSPWRRDSPGYTRRCNPGGESCSTGGTRDREWRSSGWRSKRSWWADLHRSRDLCVLQGCPERCFQRPRGRQGSNRTGHFPGTEAGGGVRQR